MSGRITSGKSKQLTKWEVAAQEEEAEKAALKRKTREAKAEERRTRKAKSEAEGQVTTEEITMPEGWKDEPLTAEENPWGMVSESSFALLFPKHREEYILACWPVLAKELKQVGVTAELDIVEGTMSVRTTSKCYDPYTIIKARDIIKLLARSVPYEQARRLLDEGITCEIIKISAHNQNKERFIKRRQRLIGPSGSTLKAIELLTKCYITIHGSTVAAVGPHKGVIEVKKIAEQCMRNYHPIYNIKKLMIKRELADKPEMKNIDWAKFIPEFKASKKTKGKKPYKIRKKKEYTPFPPPQPPSKIDLQIESGEYFASKQEWWRKKRNEKIQKSNEKHAKKAAQRENNQVKAPKEKVHVRKQTTMAAVNIDQLKSKVKKGMKK